MRNYSASTKTWQCRRTQRQRQAAPGQVAERTVRLGHSLAQCAANEGFVGHRRHYTKSALRFMMGVSRGPPEHAFNVCVVTAVVTAIMPCDTISGHRTWCHNHIESPVRHGARPGHVMGIKEGAYKRRTAGSQWIREKGRHFHRQAGWPTDGGCFMCAPCCNNQEGQGQHASDSSSLYSCLFS